jgi:hypothetical protein
MTTDLLEFIDKLRVVNPSVRVVLTVSPVSLIATFEPRHVLVSTVLSKAALRVVADEVARSRPSVAYFPAFEIIAGPASKGCYLSEDRRDVTPAGVARVMALLKRHYFVRSAPSRAPTASQGVDAAQRRAEQARLQAASEIICDEEAIVEAPSE